MLYILGNYFTICSFVLYAFDMLLQRSRAKYRSEKIEKREYIFEL